MLIPYVSGYMDGMFNDPPEMYEHWRESADVERIPLFSTMFGSAVTPHTRPCESAKPPVGWMVQERASPDWRPPLPRTPTTSPSRRVAGSSWCVSSSPIPEHLALECEDLQEAIDLAIRLFVNPGDRVCVEDPGYRDAVGLTWAAGRKAIATRLP
jgi:hypothetical protein